MESVTLTWQAWFTVGVIVSLFAVLSLTKLRTDVAFLCAMVALYASGILSEKEAFEGFSSNSVLVVGAMFCVIAGLTHTGVLDWVVKHLMGSPKSLNAAIVHVMAPVALLSSVLSNTTVVALFVNVVKMWSRKLGIAPSKLLIPLSYASGMGGICTLIGTPPNLIISGMYAKDTGNQMGIFTPLLPGLFCLAVGILSMLAMKKLLPERKSPLDSAPETDERENEVQFSWKTVASSLILLTAILLSAFNVIPLLESCLLAAVAMLVFRCCTPSQSFRAIDWSILIIFAGSAALGSAIEVTGLAKALAGEILEVCGTNPYVVLTAICLVGTFVTEFISNTAAGAMFYPIAMSSAVALGVNPVTFCVALMISVSSSFATPIGSPTHMLVYTPGGYKFSDFARTGLPMNVIILAANIFITTILFPL